VRSSMDADTLLAGFPGPVVLRPSRRKWLLVLLCCAGFVAIGVWMVLQGQSWGWFEVIFFGIGATASWALLLPGAAGLRLDANGFEVVQYFRRYRTSWPNASSFVPVKIPPANVLFVGYDDASIKDGSIAEMNRSIAGRDAVIPDTFGLSADDLASLMTRWRARALGGKA
jgi:hypothetical protein